MYHNILNACLYICFIVVLTHATTTPTVINNDTETSTNNVETNAALPQLQDLLGVLGSLFNQNGTDAFQLPAGLSALLPGLGLTTADGSSDNGTIALAKAGLGIVLSNQGVGQTCQSDFFEIVDGISSGQLWALQILDSFGKPEKRLLGGDLNWLGNYQQCLDFYITFQNAHLDPVNPTNFDTKYCRVNIPLDNILPAEFSALGSEVTLGSCVAKSCSENEVIGLIKAIQTVAGISKPLTPKVECVEEKPMETGGVVGICILVVIGFLMLIGTAYDVIAVQMHVVTKEEKTRASNNENGVAKQYASTQPPIYTVMEKDPMNNETKKEGNGIGFVNGAYEATDGKTQQIESSPAGSVDAAHQTKVTVSEDLATSVRKSDEKGTLEKIVLSFSVYTNGVKLLSTYQGSGSLGAANGIRFLSMCWVILGHSLGFAVKASNNMYALAYKLNNERWTFLAITNATFSVDSFFTLSGLLVAYLTLKEMKKVGGAKNINWFMYYFHRFWRLTPAYMLVMMVGTVIYPLVVEGPLVAKADAIGNCKETWWNNLLYINNFVFDEKAPCMGWGWYLANDMQFYVLSPLLLVPIFYNVYAGVASCLVFLSVSVGMSAYMTNKHEYGVQILSPFLPPPGDADSGTNLYIPCYTRMGPYVVGVFTGYLLYKWECKCTINKVVNVLLWLLAMTLSCTIIYSLYNEWDSHIFTLKESTAYSALSRTAWGVVVSWVVFACATGNGGWINELLSWKPFVPLGRLTYCAYLIHPILMYAYYESIPQQVQFTDYTISYMFVGHLVFSYGGAFLTSLAFESPMMGLEKAIFKKK